MNKYIANELSFSLPSNWTDQSVNIFAVGTTPPLPLSFVISRDYLKPNEELVDKVEAQLKMLEKKLRSFRIIEKRQTQVGSKVALEAEFTWVADNGPMHQRQQYVRHHNQILTFTATAPVKIGEEQMEQLELLLSSVQFHDEE